ncbi:MAG: DUF799 family lipoprotein [Planctomycetia bacterium]|nr:DUF799 family lipoprotein [Planctomycetia bacterium]
MKPYVSKEGGLPRRVAVLPFVNKTSNPDASSIIQKMFYNFFSSLSYQDREPFQVDSILKESGLYKKIASGEDVSPKEIGNVLDVDAVIYGEVASFGKIFAVVYTDYHAGLKAKMVDCKTGNLIWENYNTAHQRDVSIPTNPIGLAATVAEKLILLTMKQRDDIKVTAFLCMKMIETIPNPSEIAESGPKIQVLVHNGADKLLKPGESLKVVMVGEPGQIASWDILPLIKDMSMDEKEPGTYIGDYTVKPDDKLFSGVLVGYLKSKQGDRSRWVDILGPVYMGKPTPLPQQISADLVLSSEKSPYLMDETLLVMPQAKLVIEAGTVLWCKGLGIVVKGGIEAKGTREKPIRFMNINAEPWKGIIIDQSKGDNMFSHCEIHNAQNGIRARDSVIHMDHCLLENNTLGMFLEEGTATINKSVIRASQEIGIHALKTEITIKDSTVSENELGGILLDSAKGYISNNNIYNNGQWELKSEGSKMSCNITNNWWGNTDITKIRTVGPVEIEPILQESIKTF